MDLPPAHDVEDLLEKYEKANAPIPTKFIPPDLPEYLEIYWLAFNELSSCRQLADGSFGCIPWTAIRQWCDVYDLDEEQFDTMVKYLGEMDNFAIHHHNNKQKAEQSKRIK